MQKQTLSHCGSAPAPVAHAERGKLGFQTEAAAMLRRNKLLLALCLTAWPVILNAQLIINTIAGGYVPNNIPATSASLAVVGLAVGPSGAIYIATNNAVYRVGTNGILALYAGTGYVAPPLDSTQATQSPLSNVLTIAVDSNENLYIYDAPSISGQRLLVVSPNTGLLNAIQLPMKANGLPVGDVGLVAGGGQNVFAIDNQGNFFVGGSAEVNKVNVTTRTIQRIAGTGTVGIYQGEGGPATEALLGGLLGVAVDLFGNVFITDIGNSRIYRVDASTKIITTVAGGGPAASLCSDGNPGNRVAISQTAVVALNSNGDVIFSDSSCYKIRKIDHATGIITTLVGMGSSGYSPDGTPAITAKITAGPFFPVSSDLRTGDLYIVDWIDKPFNNLFYAGRVRKVGAANGQLVTVAGSGTRSYSGDGSPATQAQLSFPVDVAVDGTGNIYIADASNNRIRRIDAKTGLISTVAGTGNTDFNGDGAALNTNLLNPSGVAIDQSGNLLIADTGHSRVRKLLNGVVSTIAGNGQFTFGGPVGDGGPALLAVLNSPSGLAVDSAGTIYIADTSNNRVRKISVDQSISTVAGNGNTQPGYSGDGGPAINAQLSFPSSIALDPQGNILIADSGNSCVRKVIFGTISAFAGVCAPNNVAYVGDGGPATSARFDLARIVADRAGNVFLSTHDERILRVTPAGIITSVVGPFLQSSPPTSYGYSGDGGPAALALLSGPSGMTFDNSGGLLIADAANGRIRRISAATQPTFTAAGVTNGASFAGGLVAGSIGSIFGANLTTMLGINVAGRLPLPLQVAGTSVQVNGSSVPLFGVANVNDQQQVNFQVPWELAGQGSVTIAVTNYGASSQPLRVPILDVQPGIFTDANGNGAALHGSTNLPITPNSPAVKGETVAIFATGLGPVAVHPQNGTPSDRQTTTLQPTVTISGLSAPVQYSGLAPDLVGGYQLNVTVPAGAPAGIAPVVVTINSVSSNSAKLPIQ